MSKPHNLLVHLTSVLAIVVSLLHIFGVLNWEWVKDETPLIILVLLGMLTEYLVVDINGLRKTQEACVPEIIKALGGVQVTSFSKDEQMLRYLVAQMKKATDTIDDISLRPPRVVMSNKTARKMFNRYIKTKEELVNRSSFDYREVVCFQDAEMLNRIKQRVQQYPDNYHVSYYKSLQQGLPYLSFILIDKKEVIIAEYRNPGDDTRGEVRLAIRHQDVVNLFVDYYKAIWDVATPINSHNDFENGELSRRK